jgi:hypothetical protein
MAFTPGRLVVSIAPALLGVLLSPTAAAAQAWTPGKGEGAVTVALQSQNYKKHIAQTTWLDAGHIDTYSMVADVTYGITDKLAVDVAFPFVASKYEGPVPHPNTNVDDGSYHGSFTDVRLAVRYNLTTKGAVFTPYIGTVTPSHNYPFYGHAAAGGRLNELQVGVYGAKLFTSGPEGMFISGRAAYGFVEEVADVSHNRTMGDLEVGYFLTPGLRAFVMGSGQYTHGGIDFPTSGGFRALPVDYQTVHDVIQKVHAVHVGAGMAYSLNDSLDVFGSYTRLVAGRNGHALNRGINVGMSWSFSRRKGDPGAVTSALPEYEGLTAKREGALGRCICQKGM